MRFARRSLSLVLVLLVLAACASSTGFVISGESLDAVGRAFVAVGTAYNQQLDAKVITPEQYRTWATFAVKFKQSYPVAVQLWKSSIKVNDAALQKNSTAIVTALVGELVKLGTVVGVQIFK